MQCCKAVTAFRAIGLSLRRTPGKSREKVVFSEVRSFHTSPRRAIQPILWILVKPVMKVAAALTGRSVRKWWQALPGQRKSSIWMRLKQNWPVFPILGCGVGVAGCAYYKSHMVPAPITGRLRFMVVTHDQVVKIADAEAQVMLNNSQEKLVPVTDPVFQRVLSVTNRIVSQNPELQQMNVNNWKLSLIDDDEINACVVPNGHIFVNMGLIKFSQNEDQLAMVLGHEMAHALLSHGAEQLSFAQMLDIIVIAVMAAIWTVMPTDGIAIITQWFNSKVIDMMIHMPYSRKLEKEADKVGMQLAAKACYDIREGSVFWKRMMMRKDLDGGHVPEWLSTHPADAKRAQHLDHLVPEAVKMRDECRCPSLPSIDPRATVEEFHKAVQDRVTARKAGQNLRQVPSRIPKGAVQQYSRASTQES